MGSNWPLKSLKELGVSLIDCVHKTPAAVDDGVPYIGIPQMKGGTIDFSANPRLISEDDYQLWTVKAKPTHGDIVLSRRCNPGETAYVPQGCKFALGQNLVLLRPDPNKIHPGYLRWVVNSPIWWEEVSKYKNPGAIFDSLKCADIPNFEVPEPTYSAQVLIDKCLLDISDKIELNHQINQTLEQMAQSLFKSWFVDFDPVVDNALDAGFFEQDLEFPDELLRRAEARKAVRERTDFKPLPDAVRQLFPAAFEECAEPSNGFCGWVPQGWPVKTCEEVSKKIGMGPFGSNIKVSTFVEDGVPVISGTHLKKILLEDHDYKYITEEHAAKIKNSCVYRGDIIFTHAGNIGQVSLIPEESEYERYMISQRQFYMRPDNQKIKGSYLAYFFHSHDGQHKLLANASQTGVPSIARPSTHLKSITLIIPKMNVQNIFDSYIMVWNAKIMKARENIINLTKLRDTLLPKLISGELRLSDSEVDTAEEVLA